MEAYVVFNVKPTFREYDDCIGKEVAIETPPDSYIQGKTGKP